MPILQCSLPGDQGKAIIKGVTELSYSQGKDCIIKMIFERLSLGGNGAEGVRGREWSLPKFPQFSRVTKWTQHGSTSSSHCSCSTLWDFFVPHILKTTQLTAWRARRSWTVWITKQESQILECRGFSEKGSSHWGSHCKLLWWKLQLKLRHSGLTIL